MMENLPKKVNFKLAKTGQLEPGAPLECVGAWLGTCPVDLVVERKKEAFAKSVSLVGHQQSESSVPRTKPSTHHGPQTAHGSSAQDRLLRHEKFAIPPNSS